MTLFYCKNLLTESGWASRYIETDSAGIITAVTSASARKNATELDGYVIPGFQNGHSHSFQYAMGGVAEYLPANAAHDDFWTWREAMYNLALSVSPEQLEAVAAMLYSEMLRHGTTHVVEFHYLHNDSDGRRFADNARMAKCIIRAADTAGIELTLVPVFYHHGGFGRPAEPKQRRFLSPTVESYLQLIQDTKSACSQSRDAVCGTGVHSLRAAGKEHIRAILDARKDGPFHLHIAEQQKEVDDCLAFYGKRPVEWLLGEFAVDEYCNLTHATHMTEDETTRLARSGANVIICPSTEGNLGDGFFNLHSYRKHGGHYTIGSDSHIGLSPFEDLRWLDYVQRLRQERRNIICDKPLQDSAMTLITESWQGGRRARADFRQTFFQPGAAFDCLVIDPDHPAMIGKPAERALGAMLYSGDSTLITKVLRRGETLVTKGTHARADAIRNNYRKTFGVKHG